MIVKRIILSVLFIFAFLISAVFQLRADEGMWLLALLKKQNAEQLKSMGLRMPIEKLTGEAAGSLSESVIAFGSGCTGSIISNTGLILTNYHCSYDAIQQYVTPTTDIYKNGFWAANLLQELPVKGLSITINKKIVEVSNEVNDLIAKGGTNVREAQAAITKKYQAQHPNYRVLIKSYKNNALFVLFLQLRYDDVRMVGVPPKDVAKFGGETDNWMWPRQSAEFAYFRVYATKSGMPAAFSKTNIPLHVTSWLNISTEGYHNGDFAMSMGYPGMSDRNALSFQIKEKVTVLNPPMISVRKVVQDIWNDEMSRNPLMKQLYAQKYATSANYYKNAVGMNDWVNKLNIVSRKENYEKSWLNWLNQDTTKRNSFAKSLQEMKNEVESKAQVKRAMLYYTESTEACGVLKFMGGFDKSFINYVEDLKKRPSLQKDLSRTITTNFNSFNIDVDKRVTKAVLKLFRDSLPESFQPDIFALKGLHSAALIDQYVDEVFRTSIFTHVEKLQAWLTQPSGSLENDPMMQLSFSFDRKRNEMMKMDRKSSAFYRMSSSYSNSLSEFKAGNYYPDADKTLRLSYGTISDLKLGDKTIPYQTSFGSLIAKADTVNKDYLLNKKLSEIWQKKDFGKYAVNGDVPVNFITNGDVTGGNSGSPMLNADGKLIGLVFDCNWESMTREFNFEKDLHKVICVDIRYVLFITEKFSGSGRIVEEIKKANQN